MEIAMTAEQIWGIVRTILATIGGVAVGKGYNDSELLTSVLGAGGTLFVAVWSFVAKRKAA
jgi:hypothetical protein